MRRGNELGRDCLAIWEHYALKRAGMDRMGRLIVHSTGIGMRKRLGVARQAATLSPKRTVRFPAASGSK